MKEYIFYTTDGYTMAPDGCSDVENCQVLGITFGSNSKDALFRLIQNSPWIANFGYNIKNVMCRELVSERNVHLST